VPVPSNINTRAYWDHRFASGDWDAKGGRRQTAQFAASQIEHVQISPDFQGTLLDFGCGLGDAIHVYKRAFPKAKLVGMDLSEEAIERCEKEYGDLATFLQGDHTAVPFVDVIIASNVLEHLSDDVAIARHLLSKCRDLYVIVPYRQRLLPGGEHVNSYDEHHFRAIGTYDHTVFLSRGWSFFGFGLIYHVYLKNLLRPLCGKPQLAQKKQIVYHFGNSHCQVAKS